MKLVFAGYSFPPRGCRAGRGVVRRRQIRRMVALTFDDGPSSYTPQILDQLSRLHARATFFVVGNMIAGHEALLQRAVRERHALGNHSWSHAMLPTLSSAALTSQLRDTQQAVYRASGYRPCLMRPPYGAWNGPVLAEARRHRLQPILWDVDPTDWGRPGTAAIVQRALASVRGGSIVLMHDGGGDRSQTLAALPLIIRGLRERGLRPVTLPRLLGLRVSRLG